jgi:hypothetical protein
MSGEQDGAGSAAGKTIRSHAAGVVLYRIESAGEVLVAAMNYCRTGRTTLRVIMGKQGTAEENRPETFSETAIRELRSEGFDITVPFKYQFAIKRLVHWEVVPDDNDRLRGLHLKGFLAVNFLSGKLRSHRLLEHEGTVNEEILDPPEWVEIGDLLRRMSVRGATVFCHLKAVASALHALAETDKLVSYRYTGELDAIAPLLSSESECRDLVRDYVKSLEEEAMEETK